MRVAFYWDERYPCLWMTPSQDQTKWGRFAEVPDEFYKRWQDAQDTIDNLEEEFAKYETPDPTSYVENGVWRRSPEYSQDIKKVLLEELESAKCNNLVF